MASQPPTQLPTCPLDAPDDGAAGVQGGAVHGAIGFEAVKQHGISLLGLRCSRRGSRGRRGSLISSLQEGRLAGQWGGDWGVNTAGAAVGLWGQSACTELPQQSAAWSPAWSPAGSTAGSTAGTTHPTVPTNLPRAPRRIGSRAQTALPRWGQSTLIPAGGRAGRVLHWKQHQCSAAGRWACRAGPGRQAAPCRQHSQGTNPRPARTHNHNDSPLGKQSLLPPPHHSSTAVQWPPEVSRCPASRSGRRTSGLWHTCNEKRKKDRRQKGMRGCGRCVGRRGKCVRACSKRAGSGSRRWCRCESATKVQKAAGTVELSRAAGQLT